MRLKDWEYRPRRDGPADPVLTRRSWAGPLEPAGRWIAQGGSYVAAHVRQLREDQQHSPEAAERDLGARIRTRSARETEVRFRWNAPAELASCL